jgi:hypothetical protein
MNDGQAPYVVKQYQKFGFLDVNLMVEGKILRLMEQTKTNLKLGNKSIHFVIFYYVPYNVVSPDTYSGNCNGRLLKFSE